MVEPKCQTEKAMRYKREAYVERRCKNPPVLAPMWEREADKLLALPNPPDVGPGGEVAREQSNGHGIPRSYIRETLTQSATQIAEEASIKRADLLMAPNIDGLALGIDAAESIGAENSLERMLAHQMAMAHEMAMKFADRAMSHKHQYAGDQVEACRCANASARMMGAFQGAMLTLQRLRTGGSQTVTVQHVNVAPGGQAVVGNVQTGGPNYGGEKIK
jgi:hypothetical protein